VADSQTYSSADLHTISDVYPVANSDFHPVANSHGRANLHAIPDLYAMAYVDTDTCANSYSHTDTHADRNPTNTNGYCSTTNANRCADTNGDASPNCYADANADTSCYRCWYMHLQLGYFGLRTITI
jgi:hypothetical protein